jgi:hypothetical protein
VHASAPRRSRYDRSVETHGGPPGRGGLVSAVAPVRGQVGDDAQATDAAGRTGIAVEVHGRWLGGWRCRQGGTDRLQSGRAVTIGEEFEVAHAFAARGQYMQEEAAEQFLTGQRHHLAAVMIAVVLIAQVHRLAIEGAQATVGQRDAVTVAPEVIDDGLSPLGWTSRPRS